MPARFPICAALCFLLLFLAGCSQSGWDAPYQDYLERLARTLEQAATSPEAAAPPRMPRPADIRLKFDTDHLDGLDLLALQGCELQRTLGKKNSSLGRMARDSQRLLLELEYLQLAPGCIAQLRSEGNLTLAQALQQAWNDKHRQLPRRIFNATLGAAEYRELWQPHPPSADSPENTSAAPLQALGQVNALVRQWLGGDYRFDNWSFEVLLGEVARTAKPGRRHLEFLPLVQELEQLLQPHLPPAYVSWKSERDAQLAKWASALREHVAQLQELQAPCRDQ